VNQALILTAWIAFIAALCIGTFVHLYRRPPRLGADVGLWRTGWAISLVVFNLIAVAAYWALFGRKPRRSAEASRVVAQARRQGGWVDADAAMDLIAANCAETWTKQPFRLALARKAAAQDYTEAEDADAVLRQLARLLVNMSLDQLSVMDDHFERELGKRPDPVSLPDVAANIRDELSDEDFAQAVDHYYSVTPD
jgi:hypothetical protein